MHRLEVGLAVKGFPVDQRHGGKRLHGEPVRELQIEAVERRFRSVETMHVDHRQEFLSDNGMPQRFVNGPT